MIFSDTIRHKAIQAGFSYCGFSRSGFLEAEAPLLEQWLKNGFQGQMSYLERNFDKRLDPNLLVPGAKTIISLIYNYYPSETQRDTEAPKLAKYAYGGDYHSVIRTKLMHLVQELKREYGDFQARVFTDSAPIMERTWAQKSGLGWIGKNTLLINKQMGSFFFLAEIIIDIEADKYDMPVTDHCGTCTACLDACPTNALFAPQQMDASKCISYLTIELKDQIPASFQGKMDNWMFGCDICQDVCPWNRHAKPHQEPAFAPPQELLTMGKREWIEIREESFEKLFKNSAVKRTTFQRLQRNIRFLYPAEDPKNSQ